MEIIHIVKYLIYSYSIKYFIREFDVVPFSIFFNYCPTFLIELNSINKRNRVDQADHVCIVCKYTTNF